MHGRLTGRIGFKIGAPRHFYFITDRALSDLAERTGFTTTKIIYASQARLFWANEQYMQGIALASERSYATDPGRSIFTAQQIAAYARQAEDLNTRNDGDQAAFYFTRKE